MRLVKCICDDWEKLGGGALDYPAPTIGPVYEIIDECVNMVLFFKISGFDGWWMADQFHEIEFPPAIEEEIKESLTRELVKV